jgi:hypothetical protein
MRLGVTVEPEIQSVGRDIRVFDLPVGVITVEMEMNTVEDIGRQTETGGDS